MAQIQEQYAAALSELAKTDASSAVKKMKDLLEKKGRGKLLPKIAVAYRKLLQKKEQQESLKLYVSRKEDGATAEKEVGELLGSKMAGKSLTVHIDETLIGGWRLEGAGMFMDASHKAQLKRLYDSVIINS